MVEALARPMADYAEDGPVEDDAGDDEPIRVVLRVRPAVAGTTEQITVEPPDTLRVVRGGRQGEVCARFDSVLGAEATQPRVYEQVRPAVSSALAGLNSTVFAYGQTGSGKTHTLFGGLLPGGAAAAAAYELTYVRSIRLLPLKKP